jgi:hypothetical protein
MNYAEELTRMPEPPKDVPSSRDYAKEIMDDAVKRDFVDTGAISTITTKPEKKFTGEGGPGASFISHVKAGYVDDPVTKAKIYSADRFPEMNESERLSRYRIQNGEIQYKNFDNKWYAEDTQNDLPMFHKKALKWAAEASTDPKVILGTAGQILFGPLGGASWAGAGEGIRKYVGSKVFDEPQSGLGNAADIATATVLGGIGSVPGRGATALANSAGKTAGGIPARRVANAMGKRELQNIDFAAAAELRDKIKNKFGVDLFDAQTTESRRLLDKINLYGDLPSTADMIQVAKRAQDEQVHNAFKSFLNDIAPAVDQYTAGKELSETAGTAIQNEVNKRVSVSSPIYNQAFKDGENRYVKNQISMDLETHMADVDNLMKQWAPTSAEYRKLEQFKKLWYKEDGTLQNDFVVLDRNKKSVDAMLQPSQSDTPVSTDVKKEIRNIKNNILSDMDKANPKYGEARKSWSDTQDAFDEVATATRLSQISNLEGDAVVNASRNLFTKVGNSPELIAKTKAQIESVNPEVFQKALRIHLEDIFDSSTQSTDMTGAKAFGNFFRKTIGDKRESEILKEAMGSEFSNLEDMADVMRRASLVGRRESTTAARLKSMGDEEWYGKSKMLAAATRPLMTYQRLIGDKLNEAMSESAKKRLVEAMLNPDVGDALRRIKVVGPATEEGMKAISTFLSLVIGGQYAPEYTRLVKSHKTNYEFDKGE